MGEWCVAGDVAMMASTSQVDLLKVLGVGPTAWTFLPALLAAALAAPLLSLLGTAVALLMGAVVGGGGGFDMISPDEYWREMRPLLLERPEGQHLLKFAPLVNVYRSLGFMLCTMGISQLCSRSRRRLQPRHVPLVITSAVVLSCLAILFLDWGFSQLFVRLDGGEPLGGEADFSFDGPAGEGGGAGEGGELAGGGQADLGVGEADLLEQAGGDGRLGDGAEGGAEEEYDEFADEL